MYLPKVILNFRYMYEDSRWKEGSDINVGLDILISYDWNGVLIREGEEVKICASISGNKDQALDNVTSWKLGTYNKIQKTKKI